MRPLITAVATLALLTAATPSAVRAQAAPVQDFGRGDVCQQQKQDAGTKGTLIGSLGGALLGRTLAGKGNKTTGTLLGAAVGAGVGYGVGRGSVTCIDYPPQVTETAYSRDHCRWVQQSPQEGQVRQFEVCQNSDGVWRASGRE
ncbi:MAG: glycine zipper 2TM domain-containing protein [Phenylobacterium sp.]